MGSPTIKDVARRIGVSAATVSRAINQNGYVSPEVRTKVQQAVEALGYSPNAIARSLKAEKTYTIGVVVSDIANPFFTLSAKTIESAVNNHGYNVIVCSTEEDPQKELRYLQMLYERRVDGIILSTTGKNNEYIRKLNLVVPIVVMDHKYENLDLDLVTDDSFHGAFLLANQLIQKGHRRIALFRSSYASTTDNERCRGLYRALEEVGGTVPEDLVFFGGHSGEQAVDATKEVLSLPQPPTAIFATNMMITKGVIMAVNKMKKNIAEDISLAGYGVEEFKYLYRPSITCIVLQPASMGTKSGELIVKRIEEPSAKSTEIIFTPELFIGDSIRPLK